MSPAELRMVLMSQESPRSIVLASRSPRRLQLATAEGWRVRVIVPPEEAESEAAPRGPDESLAQYVCRLALAKATAVAGGGPSTQIQGTILACDTVAEVDGQILGKPADRDDARQMLLDLSGRRHRVVSGVCLWPQPDGQPLFGDAESLLEMEELSDEFLEWYLKSGMWAGKAGACGFQDERLPLRLVAGSPSNVVGLPMELVREMLARVDEEQPGVRS
jgi:septum formation protein